MLTADSNNIRVFANDSSKEGSFTCPACHHEMVLKQGELKIWHFAHKNLEECWWESESEEHLKFKLALYNAYKALGYRCKLEYIIENKKSIIDLAMMDKEGHKIAVEIQLSNYPEDRVKEKTRILSDAGFYTLWLIGGDALNIEYNKELEQFKDKSDRVTGIMFLMHYYLYYGRIYCITKDFLSAGYWELKGKEFEISALYLKYRTKTVIDEKRYYPITNLNLLCVDRNNIKIARFYDKHYKKLEWLDPLKRTVDQLDRDEQLEMTKAIFGEGSNWSIDKCL